MRDYSRLLAGGVGLALGLFVLFIGIPLGRNAGLETLSVVVLLVAVTAVVWVVLSVQQDLLLGAAMSLTLFLPYAHASGREIRVSTMVPVFLVFLAIVVTARTHGLGSAVFREPVVRWMTAYVLVVVASTLVNQGQLGPDSLPFLVLWLASHVFFLLYVPYRPRLPLARQVQIAHQVMNVIVLAASVAFALGIIEYFRPDSVQNYFAPSRRVEFWGARGALAGWLVPLRRTGSIVGSPNAFGALLSFGGLVALGRRRTPSLLDWSVGLTLAVGVVILSTSRGATVGFLAGVSVYVAASRHRWWAVPLLATAVTVGALMPATVDFIGGGYVPEEAVVGRSLPAVAERLLVWQRSLGGGHSPLAWVLGNGPINRLFVAQTGVRGGHNLLVTNLAFFGLLGVTCVVALSGAVIRATLVPMTDPRTERLAKVTLAVFVSLLAHSMVDDLLFHNSSIMLLFFPLLAILVRSRRLLTPGGDGPPSDAMPTPLVRFNRT